MATFVWLVSAYYDYEGSTPIAAFSDEASADAFAARCTAYGSKRPACPEIEETAENDALWEKYTAAHGRWMSRHPAGGCTGADSFQVTKLQLRKPRPTPEAKERT